MYAPTYYVRLGGERLPEDLAQRIMSVEIDEEDGKVPKVTVTFTNEDLAIIDDERIITGQPFVIRWGYLDTLSWGEVQGRVQKVTGFLTRRVIAYGEALAMAQQAESRVWNNVRYSDIAYEIATKWGLRPVVAETLAVHEQVVQSNETDYKFLQRLAAEVGYVVECDGEQLRFGPKDFAATPVMTLVYRGRDGTIISFDPTEEDAGEPGEVTVTSLDPIEKTTIVVQASNETVDRVAAGPVSFSAETGAQVAVSPVNPEAKMVIPSTAATAAEAKEQADAQFRRAEESIITAKLQVVGSPVLRVGRIITLQGVGKRYNGNWRIKKATHKIGSGYTVELQIERNAAAETPGKLATQAVINAKTASEGRSIIYSAETGQVVG